MLIVIIRIVTVLAMAVFATGWVWFPNAARFDAYLGLATVISFAVTTQFVVSKYSKLNEHDQHLFNEFRALFADRSLIQIFRDHDFLISFRRVHMKPLQTVTAVWDDAAHSFTNKKLEERRATFVKAATDLAMMIWKNTIPSDGHITVIPRGIDPENLPEHIRKEAKEINALVPAFVVAHEDLIRTGNKLGATPRPASSPPKYKPEPATPLNPESVFAYLQGNARLQDMTEALIARRKLEKGRVAGGGILWLDERLAALGVKTIRELDEYVQQYGDSAVRLSDYHTPLNAVDTTFLLGFVLDIVVLERGGEAGLRDFYKGLRYLSGGRAQDMYRAYQEVLST